MNQEDNRVDNIDDLLLLLHHMKAMDKIIIPFREELTKEGQTTLWPLKPFITGIFATTNSFDDEKSKFEKFVGYLISPAVIVLLGSVGITTDFLDVSIPSWIPTWMESLFGKPIWILAIFLYVLAVIKAFFRQLKVGDKTFDLNAFKAIHPELFQILRGFKGTEPHTFETIYKSIERLSTGNVEHMKKALAEITNLSEEKRSLLERIRDSDEIFSGITADLNFRTALSESAITVMQASEGNGEVHKDALHLFSDFVLWQKTGDKLITLAKHNAYNTPIEIDLTDTAKKPWAVVTAAIANRREDFIQMDQSYDRVVVASRFDIKGTTYIYSCHFPKRHFEEYTFKITDEKFQTLLYTIVLRYTESRKGGN